MIKIIMKYICSSISNFLIVFLLLANHCSSDQNEVGESLYSDCDSISTSTSENDNDNSPSDYDPENKKLISENYIKIQEKLSSNDLESAIILLKETELLDPENKLTTKNLANTLNNYAVSLAEQGIYDKAIANIEEAYVIDNTNEQISENYYKIILACAIRYYEQKNWFESINYYTYLIQFGKDTQQINNSISDIYFNWGMEFLANNQPESAKDKFLQSLDIYPDNKNTLYQMGMLEYNKHNLVEAKYYFDKLFAVDSANTELAQMLSKLDKEIEIEPDLSYKEDDHFDIRYEQSLDNKLVTVLKKELESAYRNIGARFSYYPEDKIIVLLLSKDNFQYTTNLPHWVAGIYDGKIRIPISDDINELKKTINHEYIHVILHRLSNNNIPRWFNEGVAEFLSEKNYTYSLLKLNMMKNNLIPHEKLNAAINSGNEDLVKLAYEESMMIVEYIYTRYGINKIKSITESFARSNSDDNTVFTNLSVSKDDFEKSWKKYAVKKLLSITEQKKLRSLIKS